MRQGLGGWEGSVSEMNLVPKSGVPGGVNRVRQFIVGGGSWKYTVVGVLTSYPLCSASLVVTEAHTAVRVTGSLWGLWKRPL